MRRITHVGFALCLALVGSCVPVGEGSSCGPARAKVERVVDGDTIVLEDGTRVRYLLVDTPEFTKEVECYGAQASELNVSLVEGKEVTLEYDVECNDVYDRTLAYVSIDGRDVSLTLLERGYGCVLHIPPNGEDRLEAYRNAERNARIQKAGLWGSCEPLPC